MIRQRRRWFKADIVQELDSFPKVVDSFKEYSSSRGAVSVLVFVAITVLVMLELKNDMNPVVSYKYIVDWDHESKLSLNVDITVASPCNLLGSDVVDSSDSSIVNIGNLSYDSTTFELSEKEKQEFEKYREINNLMRNSVGSSLLSLQKYAYSHSFRRNYLPRKIHSNRLENACRIHGKLYINKMAGNFHIVSGKPFGLFGLHIHISSLFSSRLNFSHRINYLYFGENKGSYIYPLNAEEKISNEEMIYQYFIQVVPMSYNGFIYSEANDYQYSVNDDSKIPNTENSTSSMSGIFFKFDFSPMKICVTEEYLSISQILLKLCGIIGGVFATANMLSNYGGTFFDIVWCKC